MHVYDIYITCLHYIIKDMYENFRVGPPIICLIKDILTTVRAYYIKIYFNVFIIF